MSKRLRHEEFLPGTLQTYGNVTVSAYLLSSRIWYPTVCPTFSPRSAATRSAIDTADIRLG